MPDQGVRAEPAPGRDACAITTRLLVVFPRPEAEAAAVAVAEMAAIAAFIGRAAPLVGRILRVAAADLPIARLPQSEDHEPGAGENRGAIRQMHSAELLA